MGLSYFDVMSPVREMDTSDEHVVVVVVAIVCGGVVVVGGGGGGGGVVVAVVNVVCARHISSTLLAPCWTSRGQMTRTRGSSQLPKMFRNDPKFPTHK